MEEVTHQYLVCFINQSVMENSQTLISPDSHHLRDCLEPTSILKY